jgi:hypothetical protein
MCSDHAKDHAKEAGSLRHCSSMPRLQPLLGQWWLLLDKNNQTTDKLLQSMHDGKIMRARCYGSVILQLLAETPFTNVLQRAAH